MNSQTLIIPVRQRGEAGQRGDSGMVGPPGRPGAAGMNVSSFVNHLMLFLNHIQSQTLTSKRLYFLNHGF